MIFALIGMIGEMAIIPEKENREYKEGGKYGVLNIS